MSKILPTPTRYEALQQAADAFETQQAFADAIGVTQPTIWRWLNQSKQVPTEFVLRVEAATGVSRHLLRPDIYPVDHESSMRFKGVDARAARRHFNNLEKTKGRAA